MNSVWRDVRFGIRMLAKAPGYTSVAASALALGIGGCTAIFSVVYATLLEPLHYRDPERLVMVWSKPQPDRRAGTSLDAFLEWRAQSTVFEGLQAWFDNDVSLATAERPEQVEAGVVTPGFIPSHGLVIRMGRDFTEEEGRPGNDRVTVLTDSLWRSRFGADPAIVGKQVRIDGTPRTVTGVIAPGPADRMERKLYVPLAFEPQGPHHAFFSLSVMGRLKPGVSLERANAEMSVVARRVSATAPPERKGWAISVEPLQNNFLSRDTIRGLWLLLVAVAFVLLIACADVANLQLARGSLRQRELVVRAALGAGRRRLVRQLLTESVLLAGLGGTFGIALALGLLGVIEATLPPYTLPSEADIRLSVPVLLVSLLATTLAGVVSGCAPAWQATRLGLADSLKQGGRSATDPGRNRLHHALVVVEFALALSLLTGGGLAVHSLLRLTRTDLGFPTERLLTFSLPVPGSRLADQDATRGFYRRLLERVEALPGVTSATVSTGIPVEGTRFGMPFEIVGQPVAEGAERQGAGFNMATPAYFRTFGMGIVNGRAFGEDDREQAPRVAVVNETFARRYLAGRDPLAQRLRVPFLVAGRQGEETSVEWQIVGVSRDVRNGGPQREAFPEIDVPFWQSPWPSAQVSVRSAVLPETLGADLAAIVRAADPELPVANLRTMDQVVRRQLAGDRFSALLFGGFAAVALVLAALGIYGVMSFVVAQRTHELGLRMALGASRRQLLRLVLRQGMAKALAGTAIGVAGSWWVARSMQGLFPGVSSLEPATFAAIALGLLAAALLACYVPARRAAGVDPLVAMREE
jgi:putative ABC transport system permease protein